MEIVLVKLRDRGVYKSEHLQQFLGIIPCSDKIRLAFLFSVWNPSLPELLNTNGFLIYGFAFLVGIHEHVAFLDSFRPEHVERQHLKDQREAEILNFFFQL